MIKNIYKFLPARSDFFDNFLVRATNKLSLNDPFEVKPSSEFLADVCLKFRHKRFGETRDEIIGYLDRQRDSSIWSDLGISLFRENGIVSLTETKDNLLMWSHYADQHQGMVIGFDLEHPFFTSSFINDNNPHIGKVGRVLYRKERLSKLTNSLMEPYFHKSDEWTYEKEHRLIPPLEQADKIWVKKKNIELLIKQKYFTQNDLKKINENIYQVNETDYLGNLVEQGNVMCMFAIPREAISSVTFGCRTTDDFIQEVQDKIANSTLSSVVQQKAGIDKKEYCLRFSDIKI